MKSESYYKEAIIIALLLGLIIGIALGIFITYVGVSYSVNNIFEGSNIQLQINLNETRLAEASYDYLNRTGYLEKGVKK